MEVCQNKEFKTWFPKHFFHFDSAHSKVVYICVQSWCKMPSNYIFPIVQINSCYKQNLNYLLHGKQKIVFPFSTEGEVHNLASPTTACLCANTYKSPFQFQLSKKWTDCELSIENWWITHWLHHSAGLRFSWSSNIATINRDNQISNCGYHRTDPARCWTGITARFKNDKFKTVKLDKLPFLSASSQFSSGRQRKGRC